MTLTIILLKLAAVLHMPLICAGAAMPNAVDLHTHLQPLPPFIRRLYWVYYGFIGLILASFGLLTWVYAEPMAAGAPIARALSLLMAVFWLARLCVAAFVFDLRPYLLLLRHHVGFHALNVVFAYLTAVYLWAVVKGFCL
jgi:hypothetical protein